VCVRWYITYRLRYRDLVAMMAERGVVISHTTIMRWVIRYVPEFEKRWNRFARSIGSSWRVDETYISIKGQWHYLYRAVDKQGRSIDFMLRPDRGIAAAQAFFRKALASHPDRAPRKVTLDGHVPSHRALRLFIHHETRRVNIAGITLHPDERWMQQIARNVTMEEVGALQGCRYRSQLIHGSAARSVAIRE